MGINIYLNIEEWDSFANGDMKEIVINDDKFPKTWYDSDDDLYGEFRPADFALWRKNIIEIACNVEMWLSGLNAMEKDETLKMSYS